MKDKKYYKKLAVEAARTIDFKKGEKITLLDVESKTGLYFYAVIATALSTPHISAIEEEVIKKFKHQYNEYLLHRDGISSTQWKVLDYGGVVIHLMDEKSRDFYGIDKIYSDCKNIAWQKPQKKSKAKKDKKQTTKKKR